MSFAVCIAIPKDLTPGFCELLRNSDLTFVYLFVAVLNKNQAISETSQDTWTLRILTPQVKHKNCQKYSF